jgi:hypothetical protein
MDEDMPEGYAETLTLMMFLPRPAGLTLPLTDVFGLSLD